MHRRNMLFFSHAPGSYYAMNCGAKTSRDPDKKTVFISCGIFRAEIEYLRQNRQFNGEIEFLDTALHVNFDRLRTALEKALEKAKAAGVVPKVLYGYCHPEMAAILEPYGANKICAGNCLEAIVGKEEIERLDAEARTFFLTAGWVNNIERIFALGRKDFGFDFSSMFQSYRRIIVFETGVIPIDEEKVAAFSRLTGLPVERMEVGFDRLLRLISEL